MPLPGGRNFSDSTQYFHVHFAAAIKHSTRGRTGVNIRQWRRSSEPDSLD